MTAMTINAKPVAGTVKETPNQPATEPVKTAPSTQLGSKQESEKQVEKPLLGKVVKKILGSGTAPVKTPEPVKAERLTFHKEKFAEYKLVRMYLLQPGCIQYDPAFPELVLNTGDKRGMTLPLTPFFKDRIGVTLELVELEL
jgi:hypothetical protein